MDMVSKYKVSAFLSRYLPPPVALTRRSNPSYMLGGLIFAGAGLPAGPSDLAAGTSAASDLTDLTDLSLGAKTAATAPEAAGGLRVIGSGFSASERGAAEALGGVVLDLSKSPLLRSGTGEPVGPEPVEADVLFGGFAGKATMDL